MISPLAAILLAGLVFFVVVPGIGAFGVRHRWRRFRRRVVEASLLRHASYATVHGRGRAEGPVRFLGTLEGIQGEHLMWVRGNDITLAVDMSRSDVYLVAQHETERPEAPPARTSWSRLGSLPEGVKVLVSGELVSTGSHPTVRPPANEPLLAVFYDGPERTLVRRCVWSGRQLNEYWNSVTPGSLAAGTFILIIVAYLLLRQPLSVSFARLAVGLASAPVLPLLPPGVALFYLYRRAWRRGRIMRAHRDVLLLPLRYFADEEPCADLPSGELVCRRGVSGEHLPHGVSRVETPIEPRPTRYTLFGRPRGDDLIAPTDPLFEWVAVLGDPIVESARCERRARRLELVSMVVLFAGLFVNFVVVMLVLGAIV